MNPNMSRIGLVALMALLLSCSGKGKEEGAAASGTQESGSAAGSDKADANDLAKLVDAIVAEAGALQRAEFDAAALAQKLGKDPQAHFDWVRDRTSWAPYRGLLRGSRGVLLDRVGSNLDRAVLLGDLLRNAGYTVRLAHASLADARARELLDKVRPIPEQRFGDSPQRRPAQSGKVVDEANALVRSLADELYATVRAIADKSESDGDKQAIAAMKDHWWVEREDKGQWIAMDVLMPDASIGKALVAAASTSEWKAGSSTPTIADSDWHLVTIKVVVERYAAGATSESVALETTLKPAVVLDRPIMLIHLPQPWPDELPDAKTDPNARGNAAVNVKEWIPILLVGNEIVGQSGFSEAGKPIEYPFSAKRDVAETGGASIMGGFDAALGGGELSDSHMTAEWMDYEIHVPGSDVQKLRRPVFDILGPANRSELVAGFDATTNDRLVARYEVLLGSVHVLLQPCALTGQYLSNLLSASIVAQQSELKALGRETDTVKAREMAIAIANHIDVWSPLPILALWRSAVSVEADDSFIDRPNVLSFHMSLPVVNADKAPSRLSVDIASNSIGVRRQAGRSEFQVRLQQGVADTVAETLTLGGEPSNMENAATVFSKAAAGGGELRLYGPRAPDDMQKSGLPADAAARIVAAVESGYLVVAPTQPVQLRDRPRMGWWRVDPASGETIGVMDSGFHGAAEDAALRDELEAQRQSLLLRKLNDRPDLPGRPGGTRPLTPSEEGMWGLVDDVLQQLSDQIWLLRPP